MNHSLRVDRSVPPKWPSLVLRLAAVYNLLWGAWVILFPNHLFDWTGIPRPNYPGIWQCVGMIVGVYGIGYWAAAKNFVTHWPIVLVGFLGKILGPIGFLQSALTGALPWSWGLTIVTNDLIWWLPFGAMLYLTFKAKNDPLFALNAAMDPNEDPSGILSFEQANRAALGSDGVSLWDASQHGKIFLIFVRHAGCTFCRETLSELKAKLPELKTKNVRPIVVHMSSESDGQAMMDAVGIPEVVHISDPTSKLYRAYGLQRGRLSQLFGPAVWWRGFQAAIVKRNGLGTLQGDGFQLGGTFVLQNGKILESYPAKHAADRVPFECVLK